MFHIKLTLIKPNTFHLKLNNAFLHALSMPATSVLHLLLLLPQPNTLSVLFTFVYKCLHHIYPARHQSSIICASNWLAIHCTKYCFKCIKYISLFNSHNNTISTIIIFVLIMRKVSNREVKSLALNHTDSKHWSWDSNRGCLAQESVLSGTIITYSLSAGNLISSYPT